MIWHLYNYYKVIVVVVSVEMLPVDLVDQMKRMMLREVAERMMVLCC